MSPVADDQDLAYERAVLQARADPALAGTVAAAFLDEDDLLALRHFLASEHWARIVRLLAELGVGPPARVVDLGGGRGLVAAALASSGFRAVLCEPNPSDVCGRGAAERLRSAGSLDFEIAAGDVADLPRQGFDAVVCRAVLHHVEPLVPVLGSVHGALRPGGALVCSDEPTIRDEAELPSLRRLHPFVQFGVDENALTEEQYRQALRIAGFVSVEVRFPVSWADYRRFVRPDTPLPLAHGLYWRFRLRSTLRPTPGSVRSLIARRADV